MKMRSIQSGHCRVEIKIIYFQSRLVLGKHLMSWARRSLGGGYGSFGFTLCMGVFIEQGKVSVHDWQIACLID